MSRLHASQSIRSRLSSRLRRRCAAVGCSAVLFAGLGCSPAPTVSPAAPTATAPIASISAGEETPSDAATDPSGDVLDPADGRREDLAFFCRVLEDDYVYVANKLRDPANCATRWGPKFDAADTPEAFVAVLEQALAELHDHHVSLGTHQDGSPLLVPTHADLWIEMQSGVATVTSVQPDSPAADSGVRRGDVVLSIEGRSPDAYRQQLRGRGLVDETEAVAYALRVAAAGVRGTATRSLKLRDTSGTVHTHALPTLASRPAPSAPLSSRRIGDVGYIRIHNSLGDRALVPAFDQALDALGETRGLILDLRETPSGGNTEVAEPLMGRFVADVAAYQRIRWDAQHDEARYPRVMISAVAPRRDRPRYTKPVVVLVSRWTGSMGEGIAVGLEGMGRAHVVGTPMARLAGAVESYTLPHSQIGFQLPVGSIERIDGAPRETYVPSDDPSGETSGVAQDSDPSLARALVWLDEAS